MLSRWILAIVSLKAKKVLTAERKTKAKNELQKKLDDLASLARRTESELGSKVQDLQNELEHSSTDARKEISVRWMLAVIVHWQR